MVADKCDQFLVAVNCWGHHHMTQFSPSLLVGLSVLHAKLKFCLVNNETKYYTTLIYTYKATNIKWEGVEMSGPHGQGWKNYNIRINISANNIHCVYHISQNKIEIYLKFIKSLPGVSWMQWHKYWSLQASPTFHSDQHGVCAHQFLSCS